MAHVSGIPLGMEVSMGKSAHGAARLPDIGSAAQWSNAVATTVWLMCGTFAKSMVISIIIIIMIITINIRIVIIILIKTYLHMSMPFIYTKQKLREAGRQK